MTAAVELPAGVVAAEKAGECARCGERFTAGTHARRYGTGLRPLACGCHPVADRAQTAPVQPISPDDAHDVLARVTRADLARALELMGVDPQSDDGVPPWPALLGQVQIIVGLVRGGESVRERLSRELEECRGEIATLHESQRDRDRLSAKVEELVTDLTGTAASLTNMRGRVHQLEATKADLEQQVTALRAERERERITTPTVGYASPSTPVVIASLPKIPTGPAPGAIKPPPPPSPAPPAKAEVDWICACNHPRRMHTVDGEDGGCRRGGCDCTGYEREGATS